MLNLLRDETEGTYQKGRHLSPRLVQKLESKSCIKKKKTEKGEGRAAYQYAIDHTGEGVFLLDTFTLLADSSSPMIEHPPQHSRKGVRS